MFPYAIGQLFSGTISDAYDRRSTMVFGLAVYSLSSFAAGLSPSFVFFIGSRFVQGLGYAFVQPVLMAVISDIAGPNRQGLSMGYFGMSTSAGVTTGPLLAGVLAVTDWRLTFLIIGLLALALIITVLLLFSKVESGGRIVTVRALGKQLASAVRNRNIALLSLTGFLAFLSQIGIMSFVAEHLESAELSLSSVDIGIVLGVSGFLGLIVSPISGKLVDVRGARCCASVGFVLVGSASLVMQFAGEYWEFLALMSLMGVGSSFMWASLLTMVVRAYPSLKGTSSSVFNSARFTGYAISPLALTPLYLASGFASVMLLCAAIIGVALALTLWTDRSLSRR
jgi:MFS family permease